MYVQIKILNILISHQGMKDILINKEVSPRLYAIKRARIKLQAATKYKAFPIHLAKAFEIIRILSLKSFMRGLSIHLTQVKIIRKIFKT
jgi:hypothetical protein